MENNKVITPINIKSNQMKNIFLIFTAIIFFVPAYNAQNLVPVVPPELRGRIDAERMGTHDANKIRTLFYNYGMVGDYPPDPINVDLSVFHSMEVPKGTGENYSDGVTPFVLAKVVQNNSKLAYIMETGFRERQGTSPITNKTMRFEPRPGYLQTDPAINKGRSIAMSNDPRTWPDKWQDKLDVADDPGWSGSWNGYFGKSPKADQESYSVYDDNFYDAWDYYPDSRDNTRRGLGLRVEQRGFQWANPQAGYVVFFHYDITNESTTSYDDNIIFGLYMDSGVGGSGIGVDGIPESDDDNAFFDKSTGLNLVYTWDKFGHGMKGSTGYLGYSYLETPGNGTDGKDNDDDGITDEKRDSGPGERIIGQDNIRAYVTSHYNLTKFESFNGPLDKRPAYIAGVWWTGDEDLDWVAQYNDTGADGVFGTNDTGEKDGIPTNGETNFDKTDIDESDQIGLTGFKMNRIRSGVGNPSTVVDNITFFDDGKEWPKRLFNIFTTPDSAYDQPVALNYNIGFLFASGPFKLSAGKTERFSLACSFGKDLRELKSTTKVVQQIYKANYQFSVPPPMPTLKSSTGDRFVTLSWDNAAENGLNPVTNQNDFEGYRIYRSTDPSFLDPQVIFTGTGTGPIGNGKPIVQYDLNNQYEGFSATTVEGVAYFLGSNTGLMHTFTDSTVNNGQKYYYAICAYNRGVDSIQIYPSENAIAVSQTLRGGTILPKNVVEVTPNPPANGYVAAKAMEMAHTAGNGLGTIDINIVNNDLVPEDHLMQIEFQNTKDSVRASTYMLVDITKGDTVFSLGYDLDGEQRGPIGRGVLPVINTAKTVTFDSAKTGFKSGSSVNYKVKYRYAPGFTIQQRRPGFPYDVKVVFSDQNVDTSIVGVGLPAVPTKFSVFAATPQGDVKMKFRFRNPSNSGTLGRYDDYIEVLTALSSAPTAYKPTWRFEVDTTGLGSAVPILPTKGDQFNLKINVPFSSEDKFTFRTKAQSLDATKAKADFNNKPYVVPNPYVGAASFEPQRFGVQGRGERKIEFRNLPANCTVRIYTITGELVQTLHHDGNITKGIIPWDLRNRDNLEIAPGLYIYHVDGAEVGNYIGKFAVIK